MAKAWKSISGLVTLALVLSLGMIALPLANLAEASPGTHYYVDATNGNDTWGDGTQTWIDNAPAGWGPEDTGPWKTITYAVETGCPAGTSPADPNVIHVAAGTYDTSTNGESFPIDFDNAYVSLIGAGAATTTVDGEDSTITTPTMFDINATGITIQDFTLEDADTAINADVGGFNILDNIFSNDPAYDIDYGVYFSITGNDRTTDFTFDDILINGNEFYISTEGVYLYVNIDYDNTKTGLSATIGDIAILDNVFDMGTTDGIDIRLYIYDITSGSVSIGDIDISNGNEFYKGHIAVHFDSDLERFTDTTVTVGDLMINDNDFYNQTNQAIWIEDYYHAYYWEGTTTATFGTLEINGNDIDSDESGCDGIYIEDYAYWEYLYDDVTVTAGNIYIDDNNTIDVDGDGIYFRYYKTEYLYNNASVTLGDLSIQRNVITSTNNDGIYVEYDNVGYEFLDDTQFTAGDFYIVDNEITYAGDDAIYVYFHNSGYNTEDSAIVTIGDLHIEGNQIGTSTEVGDDGIYVEYYCFGYNTYDYSTVTGGNAYIQNNNIDAGSEGIYLNYHYVGYRVYDSSDVAIGEVHMTGNTIDAGSEAIYIYYDYVAYYMCEDGTPSEDAALYMGDIYIQNNTISGDSDGIYIYYYDYEVGYEMYDYAYAELPDYIITGNTFNVTGDGIYLYTNEIPYDINDNSIFDFGGMLIDDNIFNGLAYDAGDPMDYGIYLNYEDFCYPSDNDSTTIIGDITITNNKFYDLDSDAIYVYYDDIGYELCGNALLQVGDLEIADNIIDGADNGIWVYYFVESYNDSTLTMGNLDITGNDLSNITWDGIHLYYDLDADGNSTQTIGRALIQDNILDPIGAADGIYVYMYISEGGTSQITLGEPIIDRNLIEYWTNGIYLENVDGATVTNNLIKDNDCGIWLEGSDNIDILYNDILTNPGPASGVHLDMDCGPDTVITDNNIVANSSGDWGVYNASTNVIDAENNWWGDPSGPDDDDGVINGSGDKISTNVDAAPWLTQQSHVTIYEETTTATATGTTSVQTAGGAVTDLKAVDEGTLPNAGKPDLTFPHGFFSFNIIGLNPGQTVTVTITLPANVPVGTEYWKYHASEGGWIEIPMGSDNGDNVITITLVDGGLGDDDGLANGVIVDQGAPGFVPHPVGVGGEAYPVNKLAILAPWLGLAVLLIGSITWFTLRRRKAYR